ncbi:MAG TPA: hypothetical protein IGS52_15375 [Oscillatoriaceae cyanobacterium M33_DOE_052]|uniref:Uncharacterized protein n=1 Tax=Planktothricoides sp. SpSt-374 TaxID=2282167 RepID=A0A7C3ZTG5_9CYAN|nr:hypothetical protein [Oscillatoriaceae cyanobacterium M33_DOE_052]
MKRQTSLALAMTLTVASFGFASSAFASSRSSLNEYFQPNRLEKIDTSTQKKDKEPNPSTQRCIPCFPGVCC